MYERIEMKKINEYFFLEVNIYIRKIYDNIKIDPEAGNLNNSISKLKIITDYSF